MNITYDDFVNVNIRSGTIVKVDAFPIAGFESEFLLLGFPDEQGNISLILTNQKVPNGQKLC